MGFNFLSGGGLGGPSDNNNKEARVPSELDPLLPRNPPAPEISGYGYSKSRNSAEVTYEESPPSYQDADRREEHNEDDSASTQSTSTKSALRGICSIFAFVMFIAFLSSIFLSGGIDDKWGGNPPYPKPVPGNPSHSITERVDKILRDTPLIDGHDDLAIFLRFAYKNHLHTDKFRKDFREGGMKMHVDLPRLKKGKVGGAFWSAFVPCPKNASWDFSDQVYGESVSTTLAQIDLIRRLQAIYPDVFSPPTLKSSQALSFFHDKKSLVSPISIEGLHQISQTSPASTLRVYHTMGVRAATLTWNCHNAFADAALIPSNETGKTIPAPPHRGGLTPAGRKLIKEMNRAGMLVDLSHTSYWTQKAVLTENTSRAPVMFSHSSAFTICQHPRNVHDDILDLVKATNSIVMINFTPEFISCLPPPDPSVLPEFYPQNNTLHQVARHVVYVGERIGYDHVGFGSDFDGTFMTPKGLDGVDKFPDLVAELLRMGVSDADASKIVGGNILRVWRAVEHVSKKMFDEGVLEMEDEVPEWKEDWEEEMFKL
jgi:membrane dipeptidase